MLQESTLELPLRQRLLALSMYLGTAPLLLLLSGRWRDKPFLQHHFRQSGGIFVLLIAVLLVCLAVIATLSAALVLQREFYEGGLAEAHALRWAWRLFLCWTVFWAFGAGMALLGAQRDMPLVDWFTRRPRVVTGAWILLGGAYLAGLFVVLPVTAHAAQITQGPGGTGRVYMLYEDNDTFPRWVFTLGFYRAARASQERYGPGNAVLLRLSTATIEEALAQADFIFIGSHGTRDGLLLGEGAEHHWLTPEDVRRMRVNPELGFVYLTGCDSGAMRTAWEGAFAPAEVVAFDRLTAVIEHIWWLWFRAPRVIRQLH